MKTDKVLNEYKSKRTSNPPVEPADWLFETDRDPTRSTLVDELPTDEKLPARTLADIKIGLALPPIEVDPKNTVGVVIEPEKDIEWVDIKEKR